LLLGGDAIAVATAFEKPLAESDAQWAKLSRSTATVPYGEARR
jgi:hypothetical protein